MDLLLLQFSPQLEEMERFAEQVIGLGSIPSLRGSPTVPISSASHKALPVKFSA